MLRLVVLISLAMVVRGLQMRETVRRVVVVRTSGSDLQPAATGYIYDKDTDGPERLVHMQESEALEHLNKLYAPHRGTDDHASSEERVIPVKEHRAERVDGLADVDYRKIFDEYSAGYNDERPYHDYLKDLKRFRGALHHTRGGDSAEDDAGKTHRSGRGDAGNYRDEKFESYSISRDHRKDDGDAQKRHHDHGHYRGSEKFGEDAGKEGDPHSFRSVYDKSDLKDDHDYFGKGVKGFADEHQYYGTGDRGHKYYHNEPKHRDAQVGHVAEKSAEDQGATHSDTDATSDATGGAVEPKPEGDQAGGRSYGYKIKH